MNNWSKLHSSYSEEDWINKPNIFATEVIQYFPKTGKVLELGAGQGQDSRYFAEQGYEVTSTDISEEALKLSQSKVPPHLENKITLQNIDISQPLPFSDQSFDIVYAHLSIHYFPQSVTEKIVKEMHRVLKTDGVVAILVNTTEDPEYSKGSKIEEDFFLVEGISKRYFSVESLKEYVSAFKIIVLDNSGETYKDAKKGVHGLIRFVGRKEQ